MTDHETKKRVCDVVDKMRQGAYRLPNIQRGFEWDKQRIVKFLDSIMRSYPIGVVMVWMPTDNDKRDILTRPFVAEYDTEKDYRAEPYNPSNPDAFLVLDGQQRLQSLLIAFAGSMDGERVYLKVDHEPGDKSGDTDFRFEFLSAEEANQQPAMVHPADLRKQDSDTKSEFAEAIAHQILESEKDPARRERTYEEVRRVVNKNVDRFIDKFCTAEAMLFQVVREKTDYDQVLEIFERVNSGGMVLDKADLLFSTIKLKSPRMEEDFGVLLDFMNRGAQHSYATDFLIKTCLVLFGKKAKYSIAALKDAAFVDRLDKDFGTVAKCIRQMTAWLDDSAHIKCSRFLRSQLALIPILDFMFQSGSRDKPDGENAHAMTEYLYMSFFRRLFSRASDSVLDQLHDIVSASSLTKQGKFPLQEIRDFMLRRQAAEYMLADRYFESDADLMLNIVDGGVTQVDQKSERQPKDLKLEVDHIFPRDPLTKMGLGDVVNHIGNYRLLVMPANRRKKATMPDESTAFFGKSDEKLLGLYRSALEGVARKDFIAFRDARAQMIRDRVSEFLCVPVEGADELGRQRRTG